MFGRKRKEQRQYEERPEKQRGVDAAAETNDLEVDDEQDMNEQAVNYQADNEQGRVIDLQQENIDKVRCRLDSFSRLLAKDCLWDTLFMGLGYQERDSLCADFMEISNLLM